MKQLMENSEMSGERDSALTDAKRKKNLLPEMEPTIHTPVVPLGEMDKSEYKPITIDGELMGQKPNDVPLAEMDKPEYKPITIDGELTG